MNDLHLANLLAKRATATLLFGNLVIGIGVMVVPGMLNHLAKDLSVSIPVAGQLIALAAVVMAIGAPTIAAFTSSVNRRLLLTIAQLFYMAGALLCAAAPQFAALLPTRALMVIGAAIFTPQAAATIGLLVPPEKRSGAVTTIFMGWSISAVIGMPVGNLIAEHLGWRYGFGLIACLALVSAIWVWRVIPSGLTVPKLSFASWQGVFNRPRLMTILAVTLISSSGQFTILSYVAPYLAEHVGASPTAFSLLMALNGIAGVAGSLWVTKNIARLGAEKTVRRACLTLAIGISLWAIETIITGKFSIGNGLSFVMLAIGCCAWGAGSFATNSTQQARLAGVAPELASASIALNSSAMYAGQSIGALIGGLLIAGFGFSALPWMATGLLIAAFVVSNIASKITEKPAPKS
jgi:predicted MFS family arabinose efflux permease